MSNVIDMIRQQTRTYRINGTVQGVGFRPFVYRLAHELKLAGWVRNGVNGVLIHACGTAESLALFERHLLAQAPPAARINCLERLARVEHRQSCSPAHAGTTDHFVILDSLHDEQITTSIPADLAICPDCLREMLDPTDRRYRHPFINCTNCGPRYSLIESLPYDRARTSMRLFPMCPRCQAEYDNPLNRRFHAQPIACPHCGPHVEFHDAHGQCLFAHDVAIIAAANAIARGQIVAVKGLGGFHLMVNAADEQAVERLRQRKNREAKPLAVMYPDMAGVQVDCQVSAAERDLLQSMAAPIVLLRRKASATTIAPSVAPGNPYLGVMLPYTPLHHLLMLAVGAAVVATSGNRSDEPICIDERDALQQLDGIADCYLVHNRPIVRAVDDSVAQVVDGQPMLMRRARGYAPQPVLLKHPAPPLLAVGAHLKNTIAISTGNRVFLSQHVGDLETASTYRAFEEAIASLGQLYHHAPSAVVCDLHPDYLSSQYARRSGQSVIAVQHHYAHLLACMAEHGLEAPALGIAWDGTGLGTDGDSWGGEFLRIDDHDFTRVAHLKSLPLPGGDSAARQPRRCALGLLYELYGDEAFGMTHLPTLAAFTPEELRVIGTMLNNRIHCPRTTSAGRLFDAVASLADLRQQAQFEAQAAMDVQFAAEGDKLQDDRGSTRSESAVRVTLDQSGAAVLDWSDLIHGLLQIPSAPDRSAVFSQQLHRWLVEGIVAIARRENLENVVLSGGCFLNRPLLERAIIRLRKEGFHPHWPRWIPPSDNGIALGQIIAAMRQLREQHGAAKAGGS